MNYKQIESLKLALSNLARQGSRVSIPSYCVNGKIIGIGFKPYWTSPLDSKIEKLEIDFINEFGRVMPFNFHNIINYDVVENDGCGYDSMKNMCIDIYVYSPKRNKNEDPFEKVCVYISPET